MKARITVTEIPGTVAGTTTVHVDHSIVNDDGSEAIGALIRHPNVDASHLADIHADGQSVTAQHGFKLIGTNPIVLERSVADHAEANKLRQSMDKATNHDKFIAHHERRRKGHK
jgi:uncharacterized protein (DUF1800 family)